MSDHGYTLAETLVAVAILAMAIGGLSWGIQVIGRWQAAASAVSSDVEAIRAAQAGVDRVLAGAGPFRSDVAAELSGDGQAFSFACGQPAPCAVSLETMGSALGLKVEDGRAGLRRLSLRRATAAHFVYLGEAGQTPTWPPSGARQLLRAIALVGVGADDGVAILRSRVWTQEPATCAFDVVLQDCR